MPEDQINGFPRAEEGDGADGLTPIHGRIHCAATPDTNKDQLEYELDQIAIDHFLDTLAEVALAIARRRQQLNQ